MLSKRKLTVFLRFVDIDNLVAVASWLVDGISSIIDDIKFLTCLAATNYPKWSQPNMAYYIPSSLAPQNTYHMYLRDIATVSFTWSREHNSSLVYLRLHSIDISFTNKRKNIVVFDDNGRFALYDGRLIGMCKNSIYGFNLYCRGWYLEGELWQTVRLEIETNHDTHFTLDWGYT